MRISPRIRYISVISISSLVLFACIATIIAVWVIQGKVAAASVHMLKVMDESTRVMRNGAMKMDTGLTKIEDAAGKVESISARLEQSVNDRGVIMTLLPEAGEQELTATYTSVQEDFAAIKELLIAVNETIQAVNRLPFIDLPQKGLAAVETLENRIEQLAALVDGLKADIRVFRSGTAKSISKITATVSDLNTQLISLRANLKLIDSDLENIQVKSKELQQLIPVLLISIAVVLTLLAAWVGYSQVVVVQRAITWYRETRTREPILEPIMDKVETAPGEIVPPNTPVPTGAESSILKGTGQNPGSPS